MHESLRLPADPRSPGQARHFVADALEGCPEAVIDTVVLLTSELVANAVVHADSPVDLVIGLERDRLRVSVSDAGDLRPKLQSPTAFDDHGRGLQMVSAEAEMWGVDSHAQGKTVWFQVGLLPPT